MKRPVAVFGFTFLLVLLAATRLPLAVIFPFAILLAILFGVSVWLHQIKKVPNWLPVVLASACLAFSMLAGYAQWKVKPIETLAGQEFSVSARVTSVTPSNGGDTSDVTLQMIEGIPNQKGLTVDLVAFPEVKLGDVVETTLTFYALRPQSSSYSYTKGQFVGARVSGDVVVTGQSWNVVTYMRLLQYKASENIQKFLPDRLSATASAMALGDTRTLSDSTKEAYRMAGLSHVLVVSGMHLSVLCGVAYELLLRKTRRIRLASIFCMILTVLFMCFTGFSPSVMRSGITYLLLYSARLFRREADTMTSLGIAALLMCLQNPYAANDVGLLLSFSATLGALQAAKVDFSLQKRWYEKPAGKFRKLLRSLARVSLSPAIVSMATLPVLLAFGYGVSALSLLMNVLALPFVTPIVLIGILLGALGGISWLTWLLRPFAFVAGIALVVLEYITEFCAQFDALYFYIGGALAVAILLLYPIFYLAYKTKWWKSFISVGLIIVLAGGFLNSALTKDTVRVNVAGSGTNPSLVVTSGDKCVILYRDRRSVWEIQQIMQEQGIEECVLFIDMRATSQTTEYISMFEPEEVVVANVDIVSHDAYMPLPNTEVTLQKQGDGMVSCVDIDGYRVALSSGAVNMGLYPPVDIFVAGSGKTQNVQGTVLVNSAWPTWLQEMQAPTVLESTGNPVVWVRPKKSVLIKEVV